MGYTFSGCLVKKKTNYEVPAYCTSLKTVTILKTVPKAALKIAVDRTGGAVCNVSY
jgi:hypothetical protein